MSALSPRNEAALLVNDDRAFKRLALGSTLSIVLSLAFLYMAVKLSIPSLVAFVSWFWLVVIAFHLWLAVDQRRYVSRLRHFLNDHWGAVDIVELRELRRLVSHLTIGVVCAWVVTLVMMSVLLGIRFSYDIPELITFFSIHMAVSAMQATSHIASRNAIRREIEQVQHLRPACQMAL